MHIPDGYLSTRVWAATDAFSVPAVLWIARRAQAKFDHHQIPLLGIMGAFVFAAQMINFPVGNGTSGHLVGSALLACTLGPAAAAIVMTAILATQALLFQDGGLLALGANVFNMAIAGVFLGYLPFVLLKGSRLSFFFSGFLSLLTAALLALSELLISDVAMPPAMLGISLSLFVVSAAIEGAITMGVAATVERIQPGCLRKPEPISRRAAAILAMAGVAMAAVGGLIASGNPDGIEAVARQTGIWTRATSLYQSPLGEYQVAFVSTPWLARGVAGVAGVTVIYAVCAMVSRAMAAARPSVLVERKGA
jgi:cobalt/nickel transport system permease protein